MYRILRTFLFLLSAEKAHKITTRLFVTLCHLPGVKKLFHSLYGFEHPKLNQQLWGLNFKNPVGLAAGFDKDAELIQTFPALGFGFLEVGTITPKPQDGNPKPRLFRLKKDRAIINRMGFNNKGLDHAKQRLASRPDHIIIGGNIGKNKVTPNERATDDYVQCFEALHELVDYFVVNVSSPNTPDLRSLQDKEPLKALLSELATRNAQKATPKPILLKIAPDLTPEQLSDILEIVDEVAIDGIIATNTTIDRGGLHTSKATVEGIGAGGLSGAPLQERSTEIIREIRKRNNKLPIVAVGGIVDEASALEKWKAGASLLQVYTGFIYEGPGLIKRINKAILRDMEEAG